MLHLIKFKKIIQTYDTKMRKKNKNVVLYTYDIMRV